MNIIKINNIAELKQRKGIPNTIVNLLGYYVESDGGQGNFYWDNSSVETDNGGTIISVNTISTGRWKRIYDNKIFTKWFGVKADGGISDDTVFLQKALNSLKDSDTLFFNKGEYFISSELIVNTDNVSIDGNSCIIKASNSVSHLSSIFKSTKNNLKFRNLSLNGNKTASVGIGFGIYLQNSQFSKIEDCNIYNTSQCAIRLEDTNDITIENNKIHDCGITGYSDNHGIMIYSLNPLRDSADNITIQNNYLYNIKRKGITTYTTSGVTLRNIIVRNNKLVNCELAGVFLSYCKDLIISENIFYNNYIGIQVSDSSNSSIINNNIKLCNSEGIVTFDIKDVIIKSNIISNIGNVGINIRTTNLTNKNLLVSENLIKNTNELNGAYSAGISLGLTEDSLVIGNKMINDSTFIDVYGIVEQSTSNYNQFINNVSHRNTQLTSVLKQGVNSIANNNIYY